MKMIVKNTIAAVFFAGFTTLMAGSLPDTGPLVATNQVTAQQYTCPMHPEVVKDSPGDCPKCGMKLVEKNIKKGDGKSEGTGSGGCCGH